MISPMVEAALRSLLVAAAVAAGLRALRVRNVLAQKSAWTLVLAAALAMPFLLPIAGRFQILPDTATISLPPHPLSYLAALLPRPAAYVATPRTASQATPSFQAEPMHRRTPDSKTIGRTPSAGSLNYVVSNVYQGDPAGTVPQAAPTIRHTLSFADLAWLAYLGVAVTLLFRLFVGLASALLIWMGAAPVTLRNAPGLVEGLAVRSSREVASPVTIASAVVLPADYADWDMEKLRIVLAHERSHIRQGDFYLQFLAGLYAAVVWFSPLGWWLKSKLSDLAETISDRAGLEQAVDCASYAQILLEFAAAPRPTLTGVAMARSGSLSRRIERLLNDHNFRQAFAGGRGRVLVAVLLVPMSLFVATSLIRVKAAGQAAQPAQPAPAAPPAQAAPASEPSSAPQPEAPVTGQAMPEPDAVTTVSPAPDAAPPAPIDPVVAPAPPAHIEPRIAPVAPAAPNGRIIVVPKIASRVIVVPEVPAMTIRVPDTARIMALAQVDSFNFRYSMNGESWGIVRGNGEHVQFSGDLHTADIDKIRKVAHGEFLWFKRGDKYYYVDDPATLAHVEAMYKPMDELGKQQEELGRKQEELGRQQEALGRKQEQVSVPTPDISKEIAELNAAMAKLQAKMGKTVTQEELADLQGKLGDLQGRLGDIQGEMGAKQGAFGAQQGQLGEQQGRLGAEQGRLGAEQGRIAMEADRKVKSIIDESLQNGKAHPVE